MVCCVLGVNCNVVKRSDLSDFIKRFKKGQVTHKNPHTMFGSDILDISLPGGPLSQINIWAALVGRNFDDWIRRELNGIFRAALGKFV